MTAVHRDSNNIPDRVPPQSVDLEMCVLGGIMLDPVDGYPIAAELLFEDSFYLDGHGLMFRLMGELHKRGIPPDMNAMLDELRSRELLDKVGGSGVVMGMLNSVPTAANVEYHTKKVAEKYYARELITKCTKNIDLAYRQEIPIHELLQTSIADMTRLSDNHAAGRVDNEMVHLVAVLEHNMNKLSDEDLEYKRMVEAGEKPKVVRGLPTGIYEFDSATLGLLPAGLYIIAARPSVGKTALALTMMFHLSVENKYTGALFSLEMSAEQLADRMLAIGSSTLDQWGCLVGVSTTRLHSNQMSNNDWSRLTDSYARLVESNIFLDDTATSDIATLRAKVRRMKPLPDYIVVDYLQLMTSKSGRETTRANEVSEISRGLKLLAKELNRPVIALSQLSRALESRPNPKPRLSDLRESGSIEQDADVVCFLWRSKDLKSDQGMPIVHMSIDKNRNGPLIEMCDLTFYPELARFYPLEKE